MGPPLDGGCEDPSSPAMGRGGGGEEEEGGVSVDLGGPPDTGGGNPEFSPGDGIGLGPGGVTCPGGCTGVGSGAVTGEVGAPDPVD